MDKEQKKTGLAMGQRQEGHFEYKGQTFRWELQHWFLRSFWVYSGEEIVGRIRIEDMKWRDKERAVEALYPVCDKWLEWKQEDVCRRV